MLVSLCLVYCKYHRRRWPFSSFDGFQHGSRAGTGVVTGDQLSSCIFTDPLNGRINKYHMNSAQWYITAFWSLEFLPASDWSALFSFLPNLMLCFTVFFCSNYLNSDRILHFSWWIIIIIIFKWGNVKEKAWCSGNIAASKTSAWGCERKRRV